MPNLGKIQKINNAPIKTARKTKDLEKVIFLFNSLLSFKNKFEINQIKNKIINITNNNLIILLYYLIQPFRIVTIKTFYFKSYYLWRFIIM